MFTAYRDLLRRLAWGWWDLPSPPADVPRVDGALEAGPLHGPLLAQAAARPDAPAVVSGDGVLTFGELHAHAATVARRLREIGLDPGEPVAISLPRGPGKVVAPSATRSPTRPSSRSIRSFQRSAAPTC
ncbi:AMP-binding protein [Salinispora arenicola]|nr:AMP-binding protein [Salinispora arenicola]